MRSSSVGAYVAAATLATTAIVHCSTVTEVVVVVDTDLRPGTEVDEIVVHVDDGSGFETERSARLDGPGATSLPLTLGVNAGNDPNAKLTVRAVGRLRGIDVSAATMRTAMVEGQSKLAHVSICRRCATTTCAALEVEGTALPPWTGSAPSAPECTGGPSETDGGADGSTTADGSVEDAGTDATDAALDGDAAIDPTLFAYWSFDEASGPVIDRSGHGHDAMITGTGAARGPGKSGGGVVFTRTGGTENGQFNCDAHSDAGLFSPSGTVSFWWRDDDDAASGALGSSVTVLSNQTSARDHVFVSRFANDDPQQMTLGFQFKTIDASTDDYANSAGPNTAPTKFVVTKGVWTRIVVSWNANSATLTVGTGLTTSIPFYRPWSPTDPSCLMGRHALGALDEVRFYTRQLTTAEINAIP